MGQGFDPRSRKIPHVAEQVSPVATTAQLMHCNCRKPGCPRTRALQQEEPPQWEVHARHLSAAPAPRKWRPLAQKQRRPSLKKEVKWGHALIFLPLFLPLSLSPLLSFLPSSGPPSPPPPSLSPSFPLSFCRLNPGCLLVTMRRCLWASLTFCLLSGRSLLLFSCSELCPTVQERHCEDEEVDAASSCLTLAFPNKM